MAKKILVVDDDKDFVDILERRLSGRGYAIIVARDGVEAIKKAKSERPDLIILDIMLPEMDGYKVSRLLKFDTKYKDIPILILSCHRDIENMSSQVGADAYLTKSNDAQELFGKIESLIGPAPKNLLNIEVEYPPLPFLDKSMPVAAQSGSIENLKSKLSRLMAVDETVYDINRSLEIDVCIRSLIDKVSNVLTAEVSSVMLLDKEENELILKVAKGIKENIIRDVRVKMGEGVAGMVAKEARPILMDDIKKYPQFTSKMNKKYKTDSFISVPLVVDGEVLGVVNVADKTDKTNFTPDDLETLVHIANHAAVSIKNSSLYEELKRVNKVRSELLGVISKDLKGPLDNVKSSIGALMRNSHAPADSEHTKFLSVASENAEKLTRIIDDMRNR